MFQSRNVAVSTGALPYRDSHCACIADTCMHITESGLSSVCLPTFVCAMQQYCVTFLQSMMYAS